MPGSFRVMLNIVSRPIANKYGDGKMKRTLERELKVPEIDAKEANGTQFFASRLLLPDANPASGL